MNHFEYTLELSFQYHPLGFNPWDSGQNCPRGELVVLKSTFSHEQLCDSALHWPHELSLWVQHPCYKDCERCIRPKRGCTNYPTWLPWDVLCYDQNWSPFESQCSGLTGLQTLRETNAVLSCPWVSLRGIECLWEICARSLLILPRPEHTNVLVWDCACRTIFYQKSLQMSTEFLTWMGRSWTHTPTAKTSKISLYPVSL